jgi:hypothetical protein
MPSPVVFQIPEKVFRDALSSAYALIHITFTYKNTTNAASQCLAVINQLPPTHTQPWCTMPSDFVFVSPLIISLNIIAQLFPAVLEGDQLTGSQWVLDEAQ